MAGTTNNRAGKTERYYPLRKTAAQVVGFRHRSFAGAAGFEYAFDHLLGFTPEQNTGTLCHATLTLRVDIQSIVEEEMAKACISYAPRGASALVLEATTGRILAMHSWPSPDSNHPAASRHELWNNRPSCEIHETGAAGRFLTLVAALNCGIAPPTPIACDNGQIAGHQFRDSTPLGSLSLEQLVARPSNIGLARVGVMVGPERLYSTLTNFGIGFATGIPLPAETAGMLRSTKKWTRVSPASVAMGYEYATSQLQLLLALNAIANEGLYVEPILVDRMETAGRIVWSPQVRRRRVVPGEIARETKRILVECITAPGGNGAGAAIPGIRVAACPGTVQIAGRQGYTGRFYAQCLGFLPADRPRISVAVAFEDPVEKGNVKITQVAPPVFREIARRVLERLGNRAP